MDISKILYFISFSIMLTLVPGPDTLFVITQSISQGKKAGIATAFGLCTGVLFHSTAAALGISVILHQYPMAYTSIKYAGGLYLLFLAWRAFKETRNNLDSPDAIQSKDLLTLYKRGILMNVLNPKVALFFVALLPQFVTKHSINISIQMFFLGVIFMLQAIIIFIIIATFSGILGEKLKSIPNICRKISLVKTGVFTLIGVSLFLF